jgi:pectin methylesterase-like acyl-CoA thioesterase
MAKRWATRRTALAALLTVPLLWMGCKDSKSGGAARDASLTGVTFSSGALRPAAFAPETLSYFLDLPFGTKTFTLAPTAADPSATITVAQDGGSPFTVASGATSLDLAAPAVGIRSFVTVVVKSGAGSQTYGFLVTQLIGHDATLSGLKVNVGALDQPLVPDFATGTTSYALTLPAGTASITVTPTANDPTATLTVAQDAGTPVAVASGTATGELPVPVAPTVSSVKVNVTAQDGTTTKTYSIAVKQLASNDASLALLADSAGGLTGFSSGTLDYTYPVPFQPGAFTVTATPTSAQAKVKVNNASVANGSPVQVQLNDAPNPTVITVEVTSQDSSVTKTYTLHVTQGSKAGLVSTRNVELGWSAPLAVPTGNTLPANADASVPVDTLLRLGFDAAPTLGTGKIKICLSSDASCAAPVDTIDLAEPYVQYDIGNKYFTTLNTRMNVLGGPNVDQVRYVNYLPVIVYGNTATIYPHNNKLKASTSYYVIIDAGVLNGGFGGAPFQGIAGTWTFTTKAALPSPLPATLNVAADNTADFATVQGAIDALPKNNPAATPYTISIADGVYQELLYIRNKSSITFTSASGDSTKVVIQYDNCDGFNPGTGATQAPGTSNVAGGGRSVVLMTGGSGNVFDGITVKNLHAQNAFVLPSATPQDPSNTVTISGTASPTFKNGSSSVTQAEALYFNVSFGGSTAPTEPGQFVAKRSNFVSFQDTLQLKGWSWFYDCFVTGDVDFIWGSPNTALFERSEIKSRYNPSASPAPSIVQSRAYVGYGPSSALPAPVNQSYAGFVFLSCALTKEDGAAATLARQITAPSASAKAGSFLYSGYDLIAFVNCSMDSHISPAGWASTGSNLAATPVTGWREYRSSTPGGQWVDVTQRIPALPTGTTPYTNGSIQLSPANVATFFADRASIFGGATDGTFTTTGYPGGWNLQP